MGSETISSVVGLVGGFGWSGSLGGSGALEPVDSAKLRDGSGAIRRDAQVQMDHAFRSATRLPYHSVRRNLVVPRPQVPYEQIPKSIACVDLRRSSNSVSNKYDLAPCVRGYERISEAPVSCLIRFSESNVHVGCLRDLVHL